VQRTTGVGSALRRARTDRGVTIDEASRDTRIRPEFIRALEAQDFGRLLGDVYVRGTLRSYAGYLGLSPDGVISEYERVAGDEPTAPPAPPSAEPVIGALRRRDNHVLLLMIVATVLIVATAFGVLSTRESTPPPATLADVTAEAPTRPIEVSLTAVEDVDVTVVVDGASPQTLTLSDGESRAFTGVQSLRITLARGGLTSVVVNGVDMGFPGDVDRSWSRLFTYDTSSPSTG
jgi:Helix-turn-helix domain/RodZ C-terminal domain